MIKTIFDFCLEELKNELKPSFRAKQIYNWIYKKYITSYDQMNNIPKDLKESLQKKYPLELLKIVKKEQSSDGTISIFLNCKMLTALKRYFY